MGCEVWGMGKTIIQNLFFPWVFASAYNNMVWGVRYGENHYSKQGFSLGGWFFI
jgi:hypothetical protein